MPIIVSSFCAYHTAVTTWLWQPTPGAGGADDFQEVTVGTVTYPCFGSDSLTHLSSFCTVLEVISIATGPLVNFFTFLNSLSSSIMTGTGLFYSSLQGARKHRRMLILLLWRRNRRLRDVLGMVEELERLGAPGQFQFIDIQKEACHRGEVASW